VNQSYFEIDKQYLGYIFGRCIVILANKTQELQWQAG